jgi:hypothetical protein
MSHPISDEEQEKVVARAKFFESRREQAASTVVPTWRACVGGCWRLGELFRSKRPST